MTRFFKLLSALLILSAAPCPAAEPTIYGEVTHTEHSGHVLTNLQKHAPAALKGSSSATAAPPTAPKFQTEKPLAAPATLGGAAIDSNKQDADTLPPDPGKIPAPTTPQAIAVPKAEISEKSAPLLHAGTETTNYNIEWFMIPSWMAGSWIKDGDMTTSETDLRTGQRSAQQVWTENRLQVNWGHQMDAKGNVWHVNLLPSERDGVSGGRQVRFITLKQRCEKFDPSQIITRTFYAVGEFEGFRGQQVDAFQQESLNHYALDPKGTLVNSSSNRVFNYSGTPVREGQLYSLFRKTGNFVPLSNLRGVDLQAALRDYLLSQGWNELVPKSDDKD